MYIKSYVIYQNVDAIQQMSNSVFMRGGGKNDPIYWTTVSVNDNICVIIFIAALML